MPLQPLEAMATIMAALGTPGGRQGLLQQDTRPISLKDVKCLVTHFFILMMLKNICDLAAY